MTDAELLRGARAGNTEAWCALYQRYLPMVWRQAYALVDNRHVAEDLTSETMVALLEGIERLDADAANIGGWLHSVVRFKAADYHRRAYRRKEKLSNVERHRPQSNGQADPTAPIEVDETRAQVLKTLDELTDRQRVMLEWKYIEGMRVAEIARRLDETEKAVEAVLYRARREFRRLFQAGQPGEPGVRAADVTKES